MKFLDFFIKDSHQLSEDEYYVKRLIVVIQLILIGFSLIFILFSQADVFKAEHNIVLLVICLTILFFYRRNNNDIIPILTIIVAGSIILIMNVLNTGEIYSYNNKWFTLILLLIAFVRPKWINFYLLFILGLQGYFFSISLDYPECGMSSSLKIEEFIDNIVYFLLAFTVVKVLFNYLSAKNKRLDASKQLLASRTTELIKSNEELERFAYIASHDLKSPLRNIISFAMLLEKEMGEKVTAKEKEYIDFIKKGSHKLNTLIEDVLNFSKISNNFDKQEVVDSNSVINEIKEMLRNVLKKKNVTIEIQNELPKLKAKKSSILLLFKNIIENGIKYNNSKNPKINISTKEEGGFFKIEFKDNGIGIDKKYHNSIFDMFSRLHTESTYEGTGLGLALSKKIIDEMNGHIQIESELGQGSSFIVAFPLQCIVG